MLSELKDPVVASLSKEDLEYRMGECILQEIDHRRIISKRQIDKPYAHCVHFALAKSSGLQEDFLFLAGENECTSISFEKYYKQVPFEKAQEGNPVFYISSLDYPAIQHAGILHKKFNDVKKCLVESQQGSSGIILVHQLFATFLAHGTVVVFLQHKDDFNLDQIRYDNEIMQCKMIRDFQDYSKKFKLAQRYFLLFELKQYNSLLKELGPEQIQRLSFAYRKIVDSIKKASDSNDSIVLIERTMLVLKGRLIEEKFCNNKNFKDSEVESLFSNTFKSSK